LFHGLVCHRCSAGNFAEISWSHPSRVRAEDLPIEENCFRERIMPAALAPTNVQIIGDELAIRWSDDTEDYFPMERLRAYSPSAENMGEQDLLGNTYGGDDRKVFPGVKVTGWQQVGGYALAFSFSDGHKTGIFSYQYLKEISRRLQN
jgi:DUF971 family protein